MAFMVSFITLMVCLREMSAPPNGFSKASVMRTALTTSQLVTLPGAT